MVQSENMTNVRMFELSTKEMYLSETLLKIGLMVPAVEKWAYILHDKDKDESGQKKEPHWHVYVKLKYSQRICHIAKWFHCPQQFINKIKGKYSDTLKYLIHENAPDKYQYPSKEVKYAEGFDWIKEKDKGHSNRLKEIVDKIISGVAREFNITDYVEGYEFTKYGTAIKRSFEYRKKLILKAGGKDMDVIFITGEPGVGKTTYAKEMASKLKYSYFIAGSSKDPFDSYGGQDSVILDDLRPKEHHISDLLKLTDNHTASLVSSRYFNKVVNEVRLMIITSVQSVEEFYKDALFSEPELANQLCRRVFGYATMTEKYITFSAYNQKSGRYDEAFKLPNLTKEIYAENEAGKQSKISAYKKILSSIGDGCNKTSKNFEDYIEPENSTAMLKRVKKKGEPSAPRKASGSTQKKKKK